MVFIRLFIQWFSFSFVESYISSASLKVSDIILLYFGRSSIMYSFILFKEQIERALYHGGLTQDLFARTQYDMLRRLRSYWIPRFLVHVERDSDLE